MGGTAIMRHLAREDVIRELTFTGRIFTGAEALTYGRHPRFRESAGLGDGHRPRIRRQVPGRSAGGKAPLNELPKRSEGEALLAESNEQMALMGSPNQVEAAKSGLEKRKASFSSPKVNA